MLARIFLFLVLTRPLLGVPPPPPAPNSCPPPNPPGSRRPLGIRCFTDTVGRPNPGDCFRAMDSLLSGNTTIDHAPLRFSNMRGVHGTLPLPLSRVQPTCAVLIDSATSLTPSNPVDPNDMVVVDTLSMMQIAEAAQEIVQRCILGGTQLGGKMLVGENNLVALFVGRAPEEEKKQPLTDAVPITNTADNTAPLTDVRLDFCAGSF